MQTPVYGKQGILPALPRAVHLESGILGKRRLSDRDDRADFFNRFRLAVFLFRGIFQIKFSVFSALRILNSYFLPCCSITKFGLFTFESAFAFLFAVF